MLIEITQQFYALMAEARRQVREGADPQRILRALWSLEAAIQSDSGEALRHRDLFTFSHLQALLPQLYVTQRQIVLAP